MLLKPALGSAALPLTVSSVREEKEKMGKPKLRDEPGLYNTMLVDGPNR